jgi:hypothetical protein
MFDLSQFSHAVIAASARDSCEECGEIPDSFGRCGCDYCLAIQTSDRPVKHNKHD